MPHNARPAGPSPRPPLWTWPAALAFAALLVAGLALLSEWQMPQARRYFFGLDRLPAPAADTVVIIGTSKTRCAVEPDRVLAARVAALGRPMRVVRIARDAATADDLPEVFASVARARPRLVLIESDMLIYEPNVYRSLGAAPGRDWRLGIRDTAQYLLKRGAFTVAAAENRPIPRERSCLYGPGDPDARHAALVTRSASTVVDRAPFIAFAAALHDGGTPIALMHIPRQPDALGAMPAALEASGEAVRQALLRDAGVIDLGPPPQLSPSDFAGVHAGPTGRDRYSAWLAARLVQIVRSSRP